MIKLERIIRTSKPVAFVRQKSRQIKLPGADSITLYDVVKFFFKQSNRVGLNERAAAISFNLIMAIPAAAIFLCTLIPYLPISKQFVNEMFLLVHDITPNHETQILITNFLDDFFNKPKTGLLSLGFVLALFYASNAMMGIIKTFDRSVVEKRKTNFIRLRLRAIRLTVIVFLLFIGTILISLGQGVLFSHLMSWLEIKNQSLIWWIQNLRWLVIILLFYYSIAFIYKYAPSFHKRWSLLSPGAMFATFLMIVTTVIFSYWAQNISNYNKFYGSIGSLLILMLLIFINSLMLIIGYELNISITYLKLEAEIKKRAEVSRSQNNL